MPIKKRSQPTAEPDSKPVSDDSPETSTALFGDDSSDGRGKSKRRPKLTVPLTDSGEVDFSRMTSDQKEKYAIAFGQPTGTPSPDLAINRDFIPHLYDAISMAIQYIGKKQLHWPDDLTVLMKYSNEQKERLTEPTARVIEKYAPKWLAQNQDVAMLCMAFTTCTKEMVENALVEWQKTHVVVDGKVVSTVE